MDFPIDSNLKENLKRVKQIFKEFNDVLISRCSAFHLLTNLDILLNVFILVNGYTQVDEVNEHGSEIAI